MKARSTPFRFVLAACIGAALLGSVAPAFVADAQEAAQQPPAPPPAPVEVALAVTEHFAPSMWAPASVVARDDAKVAAEQEGRVVALAEVGDVVEQGGVLARLDDSLLKLRESEAAAELGRIEAQLEYARRQEQRLQQLARQSTVSNAQAEEAQAQRGVLEQQLRGAQVALAQARHRLAHAVVRAPFGGTVVERYIAPGEYLGIGTPVLRIVDTQRIEVQARAPVQMAAHVGRDMQITVRAGATEQRQRVRAVVPVGDAASRQFELRIDLPAGSWPVGTALEVGLPTEAPRDVVAAPRDALLLRPGEAFVVRVNEDDVSERVPVKTGAAQGDWIEVIGNVSAGDRLVVRGAERLQPGQKVTVAADPSEPALAAGAY